MGDTGLPPLLCALSQGEGTPLFLVPSVGTTPLSLVRLARALVPRRPVHAFAYAGLDGDRPPHATIEAMAAGYVAELVALAPDGACQLGGHCLGGAVAFEMAQQLASRGRVVSRLVVMDAVAPLIDGDGQSFDPSGKRDVSSLDPALRAVLLDVVERTLASHATLEAVLFDRLRDLVRRHIDAAAAYRTRRCTVPLRVLATVGGDEASGDRWDRLAGSGVVRHALPGDTFSMLRPPHVEAAGRVLARALDDRP